MLPSQDNTGDGHGGAEAAGLVSTGCQILARCAQNSGTSSPVHSGFGKSSNFPEKSAAEAAFQEWEPRSAPMA